MVNVFVATWMSRRSKQDDVDDGAEMCHTQFQGQN
jgi:hypothetical protein